MSSLKELKGRIYSVDKILKVTSAMKMIASAKLHRMQVFSQSIFAYESSLQDILSGMPDEACNDLEYMRTAQDPKKTVLAVFSSNSSMCGSYNSNIVKQAEHIIRENQGKSLTIYPIGAKAGQSLIKMAASSGFDVDSRFMLIGDKPTYENSSMIAARLSEIFLKGEADRIELLYTHSKSLGTQEIRHSCYLPIVPDAENRKSNAEYIMEPGAAAVLDKLIPKILSISIYSKWIDSVLSENAIRSVAMQTATDNAMDLKQELSLSYNKLRQQAITSELLDMEAGMLGQK